MAYKQAKLIDFVPDPTQDNKSNALARKYHYESELARLRAAELLEIAKREGRPVMVQGKQDV